jgi:hypothetical protein
MNHAEVLLTVQGTVKSLAEIAKEAKENKAVRAKTVIAGRV